MTKSYLIVPWDIFLTRVKTTIGVVFRGIDDFAAQGDHENVAWQSIEGWEEMDNEEILKKAAPLRGVFGEIYAVTDASYMRKFGALGAFALDANGLNDFVKNRLSEFGVCFFDGDTVIASLRRRRVWLLHHEGFYAEIAHR